MTDDRFDLSRRQTLGALGTIGAAAAGAGLGTSAFFSDRETFENNRLVAGELDMKAAYSAHYSDWSDDEDGSTTDTGDDDVSVRMYTGPPGTTGGPDDLESGETGLPTNDAWLVAVDDPEQFLANTETMSDGVATCPDGTDAGDLDQPVIDLEDVKPGDFGEVTIDFTLCDNPGFVWLNGELVSAAENGTTEPEADDPDEDGNANSTDSADVELLDVVRAAVWVDDGGDGPGGNEDGNNYQNGGEDPVVVGSLRDVLDQFPDKGRPRGARNAGNAGNAGLVGDIRAEQGGGMGRNCFSAETTHSVAVAWWVPVDHGNQIQTDSATFSLGLYTEQCRHNEGTRQGEFSKATQDTVVEQTLDGVSDPPPAPDEKTSPPEGYPVSEEEFEALKEQAGAGELPQPPAEDVEEEGSPTVLTTGTEFSGWNSTDVRSAPSDANIAVGSEYAVLGVNRRWGIYDKSSGNRQFQAQLEDWFAPVTPDGEDTVFDPKALYDHTEDRFILMAVGLNTTDQNGSWLVAVSDDDNPFGTWWITRIPHNDGATWVDYPELGVDGDAIYLTSNVFDFNFPNPNFQYSRLVTIDKSALYGGNAFTYWWFSGLKNPDGSDAFTVQPTLEMTSSSKHYLVNSRWNSGNTLTLWELSNPTSNPSLSSHAVNVSSYSLPPNAEQPNTSTTVDTGDARLMNAVYEDGSVWTAHSISYDWNNDGDASAILKWYEIDTGSRSVAQSRGWGFQNIDYYFPTISTNGNSTVIVYNNSGPNTNPQIEVAGRRASHTQNSLEDAETLRVGDSSYDPLGPNRWGDYNGIVVDPTNDHYWTYSQYASGSGNTFEFQTQVEEVFFESEDQGPILINDQTANPP